MGAPDSGTVGRVRGPGLRRALWMFAVFAAALALCFLRPLYDLAGFCLDSDLFSYIPMMPVIAGYLIWGKRGELAGEIKPGWIPAILSIIIGGGILAAYGLAVARGGWVPVMDDELACLIPAFLALLLGGAFACFGTRAVKAMAFPLALLVFAAPYPVSFRLGIERCLDHASAAAAYGMLRVAGAGVDKDGLVLTLPDALRSEGHPGLAAFDAGDILDAPALADQLSSSSDGVAAWLRGKLDAKATAAVDAYRSSKTNRAALESALADNFNRLEQGPALYDETAFQNVKLREETDKLRKQNPQGDDLVWLNRWLLEDAFPVELSRTHKGMALKVAPECSGIHSSLVLLITSLLAGSLFLASAWRRALLAFLVIPLAVLRNGFRIFTLSELSIHVSGKTIDSPIHHQGGPIFFLLSLIPFYFALVWLRKSESNMPKRTGALNIKTENV